MALTDLLRALRAQAAERRAEELAAAEGLAERLRAASRSALERRRDEVVAAARRHEEEGGHRTLSRAHAEAAATVLEARDRLLARVRASLEIRIAAAARDEAFLASLSRDLSEGLARLPDGHVVVRARPELMDALAVGLGRAERVTMEPSADVAVGFRASVPDEGVEMDGTLITKLEHAWPRLAVAVLREAAA